MKKSLLITTALITLMPLQFADAKNFEGSHIGAHVGVSKPSSSKGLVGEGMQVPTDRTQKWDISAGISIGHLKRINTDLIGGFSLEGNMEKSEQKHAFQSAQLKAFRKYNINLLGKIGYVVSPTLMPYVGIGPTFTEFKFEGRNGGEKARKKKKSFGVGASIGVDYASSEKLSTNLQYLYSNYGANSWGDPDGSGHFYAPESYHVVTVGIKYKI